MFGNLAVFLLLCQECDPVLIEGWCMGKSMGITGSCMPYPL